MSEAIPAKDYERGVRAVVAELRKRRAGLNSQFEAVDIFREDSTYAICIEAALELLPAERDAMRRVAALKAEVSA